LQLISPIPSHLLTHCAELYAEAFARKASVLIGPQKKFARLLAEGLNPDQAIAAIDIHGNILGVAGFKLNHSSFINFKKDIFDNHFPPFSAAVRFALSWMLFNRWQTKKTLLMDGIAVHSLARGQGVGTFLLEGIFDKAREHDKGRIRLDVIDENPRAKILYERMGFQCTRHSKPPFLKNGPESLESLLWLSHLMEEVFEVLGTGAEGHKFSLSLKSQTYSKWCG
jgi:GNAT superfamily N-acetyltransferase